ncbi:acyltransferase, partial [Bacillus cereus]|nr:acyltransferase [Bacillus cereus]
AAVGAMSMVKESLDDWYMYVGVPVRKIKARKKNIVELENEFLKSIDS